LATIPLSAFEIAGTVDGGPPTVLEVEEAASESFVAGEPVYIADSGYLTECGDNPALVLGIAGAPAHNTTAGLYKIPVYLADSRNIFRAQAASAAGTRMATTRAAIGRILALFRDTTNSLLQVNGATFDGANARVYCLGLDKQDVLGDTGGRYLVRFKPANSQVGGTS